MSNLKDFINIEAAIAAFGEPQYGFFRQHVVYLSSGRKRGQGDHCVSTTSIQVSETEYRENIASSTANELARFFSSSEKKFTQSYWRYEKRIVTPGWPQVIKKMIEETEKE